MPKELKRLIRLRLPEDLVRAVEEMGRDSQCQEVSLPRGLQNMIEVSLMWAVWCHSRGRGPDTMARSDRGFAKWDENIRAVRREVKELAALYGLDEPQAAPLLPNEEGRD
jgi:hypothetical protein